MSQLLFKFGEGFKHFFPTIPKSLRHERGAIRSRRLGRASMIYPVT